MDYASTGIMSPMSGSTCPSAYGTTYGSQTWSNGTAVLSGSTTVHSGSAFGQRNYRGFSLRGASAVDYGGGVAVYVPVRMRSTSYHLFSSDTEVMPRRATASTSSTGFPIASRGSVSVWDIDGEVAGSILDLFSVGNTAYYEEVWDGEERPDRPPTGQYTPVGDAVLPMLALACCYVVRIFIKNRKRLINK